MKSLNFGLKNLAYSLFAVAGLFIIGSIISQHIGLDGGFYLAVARNLWEDGYNYFEIASSYNPLGIIILGLPNLFLDNPVQINYLLYFFILFIDTILFYQICDYYRKDQPQSLLISAVFLLYALLLDGHLIILEPIQLLFIFTSILFIHRKQYLLVGLTLFCAFLTKQYSLALIVPICLIIIQDGNTAKQKLIQLTSVCFIFFAALVFFYLLYAPMFSFEYYLLRLLGQVPQMKGILSNSTGTGEGYDITVFVKTLLKIILFFPLMWLPLITFKKNKANFSLLITILSFSSVFIFASYYHYFILILPWMLILLHQNLDLNKIKIHRIFYILILLPTLFLLLKTTRNKYIISVQEKALTETLKSYIPKDSKVYVVNLSMAQYAHCDFNSIEPNTIGYTFPNVIKKEAVLSAMKSGSFLIADINYLDNKERQQYVIVSNKKEYVIYKKK